MNNVKISVVTVCYNAVKELERTMLSVLNQTYDNVEYIVIDGGSTDGTVEIIKKYADRLAYWVSEPDKGIYDAMNKGIKVATGEWINFMNAGDEFFNDVVIQNIRNNNIIDDNYAMIVGDTVVNLDNVRYRIKCNPFYKKLPLHRAMGWFHQSSFVKAIIAKENLFDLSYVYASDYNMVIDIYRKGFKFFEVNEIIAVYDLNGASYQNKRQHTYETLNIDNPNNKTINFIKSYGITYICKLRDFLKPLLRLICPKLIQKIREIDPYREVINE